MSAARKAGRMARTDVLSALMFTYVLPFAFSPCLTCTDNVRQLFEFRLGSIQQRLAPFPTHSSTMPTPRYTAALTVEITDFEVNFLESIYTRLLVPTLPEHVQVHDLDPIIDVRGPLTPVLGLSITAKATLHTEGLAEGTVTVSSRQAGEGRSRGEHSSR